MDKKWVMVLVMLAVLPLSVLAAIPDPGHSAASVGAGTFDVGNFIFPGLLGIVGNLNASTINTTTLNTGQGAYELYKMDQNVDTASSPTFNKITSGNVTAIGGSYLIGQPLLGMLGSGLINSTQTNALSEVNVTCSGLTCSYNAFEVRLASGTAGQNAVYCRIPAGSKAATNNAHNVFYIDSNCAVQATTISAWFTTVLSAGGAWDFANMVCYANSCEVVNGIGLEERRMMKQRIINFNKNHLSVTSGMGRTTGVFPAFTIGTGKYIYLMDIVDTSAKTTGTTDSVEVMIPTGVDTWLMDDQNNMNYTTCVNSSLTGTLTCTNTNRYRRIFFFMIGWNDSSVADTTGLHQLLPLESTFYTSEAACLDTVANPLTYTLPSWYTYAAVPVWAYCIRPADTAWSTTGWIDLRTVKVGSATSTSTGNFVPYSGATQNLAMGNFNVTFSSGYGINASSVLNPFWLTSVDNTTAWTKLNSLQTDNTTQAAEIALKVAKAGDTMSGLLAITTTATTGNSLSVTRNLAAASTDSPVVFLKQDNAGDDQDVLQLQHDGTGNGLTVYGYNNAATGIALYVQMAGGVAAEFQQREGGADIEYARFGDNNAATGSNWLYRNLAYENTSGPVLFIEQDNAGDDQNALNIQNDGNGTGLWIDQNGALESADSALIITSDGANTAGSSQAVVDFRTSSTSNTKLVLYAVQAGTGAGGAVTFENDGTGIGLFLNQDGDGIGVDIDSEAASTTKPALRIQDVPNDIGVGMATGDKISLNYSDTAKNYISSNASGCVLIVGGTVTLAVC